MKSVNYKPDASHIMLARFCAAMGNPTLIAILEKLACTGNCVSDEIMELKGVTRFTVNMNLKYLKKYEMITGSLTSKHLSYCINYDKMAEFKELFDDFYNKLLENKMVQSELECGKK